MLASLVSVALALVGASRTLDESYYCNTYTPPCPTHPDAGVIRGRYVSNPSPERTLRPLRAH